MSLPPSPSIAFRLDIAGGTPADPRADAWLRAASELRLAARAKGDSQREYLHEALSVAIAHYGDDAIDEWAYREYGAELGFVEALMFLANDALERDAHNLAPVLLDDLLAGAPELTPLHRGRVLLLRARAAWKIGDNEDSFDRFRAVERMGEDNGLPELVARACNGLGTLAQLRGNYPEMKNQLARAADIADREGLRAVSRMAHHGLMIHAGYYRRFDDAVGEGAQVLDLSEGQQEWEAEILQSFGQLLLEMGRPDEGRACFAAVMTRSARAHVIMPALGGLAMASAITGREPTLEWAIREVRSTRAVSAPIYAANALIECGIALATLGRQDEAARYVREAETIAAKFGFHEVSHRAQSWAESRDEAPRPQAVPAGSEGVFDQLRAMEPTALPEHVALGVPS